MSKLTQDEIAAISAELTSLTNECSDCEAPDLHEMLRDAASDGNWHEVAAIAIRISRLTA